MDLSANTTLPFTSVYWTTRAVVYWSTSSPTPDEESPSPLNEVLTIGIPMMIIFVIVLSLCMVLLYSKARRRRAAAQGQRDPMTNISGGVAMNANAYMNYGNRERTRYETETSTPSPCPIHHPYIDAPPSYEDAMKEVHTSSHSGVVNMSFTASSENLSPAAPPPYDTHPGISGGSSVATRVSGGTQAPSTSHASQARSSSSNQQVSDVPNPHDNVSDGEQPARVTPGGSRDNVNITVVPPGGGSDAVVPDNPVHTNTDDVSS